MRYYCETAHSLSHTSRSIASFDKLVENGLAMAPRNILDLGCGNGRNSLYLARRYGAAVTLVDKDEAMIDWAKKQFDLSGFPINTLCIPIEQLAANPSLLANAKEGSAEFDLVIFSYVIQHIDPVYYPLIFDFCKSICTDCLLMDVFWNPSRVSEGERMLFGDVNWYGLSYEELATLVAPRFSILSDRIVKNDIAVVISMALTRGETPLSTLLSKQYEYYSGRIIGRRGTARNHRSRADKPKPHSFSLDELPCVRLLAALYPDRFDLVREELQQWIDSNPRVSLSVLAAQFLYHCRSAKIPVMLEELSRDFDVQIRVVLYTLSRATYIPPLHASEYVDRITKQLQLTDLEEMAKSIVSADGSSGCSPAVRACCAILTAANKNGTALKMNLFAAAAYVTPAAITLNRRSVSANA